MEKHVTISKEFAQKCGEALVAQHNVRAGGSVRLVSFRSLYEDLRELGCEYLIASALKPVDYPEKMWFCESSCNGEMKQFEVGKTYSMRSACDHDCVWSYIVISRTQKVVVLQQVRNGEPFGEQARFRISEAISKHRSAESVRPLGTYSMAPILSADNEV